MGSTVANALEGLRQNDNLTVALFTAIAYDYILTFTREIDYIWNKPWTIVSVLFILVRYCGLFILSVELFLTWSSKSEVLYIATIWTFVIWLGASDLVMILRVWAMYNRSRVILGTLLTLWFIELVLSLLTCIMYPNKITVEVTQVSNLAYCGVTSASVTWTKVSAISEIITGGIICILVVFQFGKRAHEMYSVTKRWHSNRYLNLFAGQSVLYFLFVIFFNRTAILVAEGKFETEGWRSIILLPLEYVPAFALTPRFIMSVRALHPNEAQVTYGRETDSGFGFGAPHGDRTSTVLEVRISSNEVVTDDEGIPMKRRSLTAERW